MITALQLSCGKVMFSQVSVCHSRGGVGFSGAMSFLGVSIPGIMSLPGGAWGGAEYSGVGTWSEYPG